MAPYKGRRIAKVSFSSDVNEALRHASAQTGENARDIVNAIMELAFGIHRPDPDTDTKRRIRIGNLLANTTLGEHLFFPDTDSPPSRPLDTFPTPNQALDDLYVADMSGAPYCAADRAEKVQTLQLAIALLNRK